jgi:Ca2+/H+ antiporter, TMEM165/GDT1 family
MAWGKVSSNIRIIETILTRKMLEAFTAGLLLITASELGDKTFFMAVVLATRYPRKPVLIGVVGALATMTVLSVGIGHFMMLLPLFLGQYLPPSLSFIAHITIQQIAALLFFLFGLKLLYESRKMSAQTDEEVRADAAAAVEAGDRKFHQRNTFWKIVIESFVLTFVAEWGDRTQIATIALAAAKNPIGVIIGGILGHTICSLIAVWGGKMIAGKISEKTITVIGGVLFILFALITIAFG